MISLTYYFVKRGVYTPLLQKIKRNDIHNRTSLIRGFDLCVTYIFADLPSVEG